MKTANPSIFQKIFSPRDTKDMKPNTETGTQPNTEADAQPPKKRILIPPTAEQIMHQRFNEAASFEQQWKRGAELRDRESELRDLEINHSYFCSLIERREVVEFKELQSRFRTRYYPGLPMTMFWEMLLTANRGWRTINKEQAASPK